MQILATSESPLGFLSQFGVELPLLISQGLSFALVAGALYWFVFRPVSLAVQQRQSEIQKGLDDAKKAATELENAQKVAEEKLSEAIAESAKILKNARDEAKQAIERATSEANAQVAEIRAKNEAQLESDKQQMKQELKAELALHAVKAAEKAVGEVLTDQQRSRLAEIAAKELEI